MTHLRYGKICSHAELGSASVTRFRNKFGMTDVLKSGITILILILSIFVLSCENTISSVNDDSFEAEQKTEVSSPYLLISVTDSISGNLLTPQPSIAARPITSLITSSLFSDISLTGTSTTGGTVSASASSFAELSPGFAQNKNRNPVLSQRSELKSTPFSKATRCAYSITSISPRLFSKSHHHFPLQKP